MARVDDSLKQYLLCYFHSSSQEGHYCIEAIMKRIVVVVYWKKFEKGCEIVYKRI